MLFDRQQFPPPPPPEKNPVCNPDQYHEFLVYPHLTGLLVRVSLYPPELHEVEGTGEVACLSVVLHCLLVVEDLTRRKVGRDTVEERGEGREERGGRRGEGGEGRGEGKETGRKNS